MTQDEVRLLTKGTILPSPAVFEDWPLGRDQRGRMTFTIEEGTRGQRIHRGSNGAKGIKTTYAPKWWIVACSDGKTRLVSFSTNFGKQLAVYDHTTKREAFRNATLYHDTHHLLYNELIDFLSKEAA